jgi:hypothetical protein
LKSRLRRLDIALVMSFEWVCSAKSPNIQRSYYMDNLPIY